MLIEATELSKRYGCGPAGQVTALDRVSLRIRQGEFLSVMGPSGSGKSTLLHLLSALDQPTSGCVRYDGADLGQLDDRALSALRRRRVGFIFQQFICCPVLTARENILLPCFWTGAGQTPTGWRSWPVRWASPTGWSIAP